MRTVIITGATGFLGRNLVRGLLDTGYLVYALVRKESPRLRSLTVSSNLKLIKGSLEHLEVISEFVEWADCFVHFAWDALDRVGERTGQPTKKI